MIIVLADLQTSEEEEGYVRPKRCKYVKLISYGLFTQISLVCLKILLLFRVLTKKEKIIQGLATGQDAPLEVREGGVDGRGVFATKNIGKNE